MNRKSPSRDIPIFEGGEIAEGLLWVTRDSQGELEELRLFGPVCEEGPGVSGLLGEEQVASQYIKNSLAYWFLTLHNKCVLINPN